jgi:hypothetical protein
MQNIKLYLLTSENVIKLYIFINSLIKGENDKILTIVKKSATLSFISAGVIALQSIFFCKILMIYRKVCHLNNIYSLNAIFLQGMYFYREQNTIEEKF